MVNRLQARGKDEPRRPAKSGRFVYKPRSSDQIKKRADSAGGRFDSIFKANYDTYRPKAGENAIRILPPTWDNHEHFGYDIWVHKYVGPDESNYLCRFKMLNKACAWCDAAKEAKSSGDAEEFKRLSAKPDVVYWVLDRDDETPMPQLYHLSGMADGEISDLGRSKRTGKTYYLDHPDQGWDVLIDRKGQGKRTRYTYKRDADAGPTKILESQKKQDSVLNFIMENPLPDVLRFYPNDYLMKLAEGGVHEKDEDLDEEERPRGKHGVKRRDGDEDEGDTEGEERPTRGRRGKNEDPDEDSEDAEAEEGEGEEEENERPSRGRRGRSRDPEDESRDEDGGEESEDAEGEEDADERPARGRRSSRRSEPEEEEGDPEEDGEGSEDGEAEEDGEEERPRERRGSSRRGGRGHDEEEESNEEDGEGAEEGSEEDGEEDRGSRGRRGSARTSQKKSAKPAKPARRVTNRDRR